MGKPLLVMRLEGPLQRWADESKFIYRTTSAFPSKSGIVGLIACCMGLSRKHPGILALSDVIDVAVRADRPGTVTTDYQTIQWAGRLANGSPGRQTIQTYRQYLEDACFTIGIQAEPEVLEQIAEALKAPHWPPYLGCKSCPPTHPIFVGIFTVYADLDALMVNFPLAKRINGAKVIYYETSNPKDAIDSYLRRDVVSSLSRHSYITRKIYKKRFEVNNEDVSISSDT